MPKKKTSALVLAEKAWQRSKGAGRTTFGDETGDPDRKGLDEYIPRWQARLVRFAVEFWRVALEAGYESPDDL